uniref:E3 ubiquitin ligase BIG BROTHER-related-like n=1 Tax=Erigeron canadensis TaxID=72917 RepID=UPI001CB92DA1|nr:E3 ubiquitin ligase BIG BROTHER-related-like [Erigeron canadensis]
MDNNNNNKKDESSSSKMDSNPNNNNSENPTSTRRPFTNLSQVDADLALARTLQDQERAYMMLRMNNNNNHGGDVDDDESDDHESWETVSYVNDDELLDHHNSEQEQDDDADAFDIHAHLGSEGGGVAQPPAVVELDPASFPNDEAYARALQDAEDQEMAARLLALTGIHDMVTDNDQDDDHDEDDNDVDDDDHHHRQDAWNDVDPDELSYEELIALGEVVGTESRGLSADSIASLRSMTYKTQNIQNGSSETCVICRLDYDDGDNLILLSCKHSYHADCITNWLQINKVCPVCSTEVSTSGAAS